MPPPSSQALQELDRLDKSSSDFDAKFHNILYGKEYALNEKNFEKDDLVWLIDYLDEVRRDIAALFRSPLKPHRLSIVPVFPPQLLGSAFASSEAYVAPGQYSRRRTPSSLNFSKLTPYPSPPEVSVTCITGPSTVRGSASNVFG